MRWILGIAAGLGLAALSLMTFWLSFTWESRAIRRDWSDGFQRAARNADCGAVLDYQRIGRLGGLAETWSAVAGALEDGGPCAAEFTAADDLGSSPEGFRLVAREMSPDAPFWLHWEIRRRELMGLFFSSRPEFWRGVGRLRLTDCYAYLDAFEDSGARWGMIETGIKDGSADPDAAIAYARHKLAACQDMLQAIVPLADLDRKADRRLACSLRLWTYQAHTEEPGDRNYPIVNEPASYADLVSLDHRYIPDICVDADVFHPVTQRK